MATFGFISQLVPSVQLFNHEGHEVHEGGLEKKKYFSIFLEFFFVFFVVIFFLWVKIYL